MAVERDKVTQAAQKLVEKKRYDKAIAEYQKIVADDPKDIRTLLKIGDLHLKLEQYVEAITTYETVGQHYSDQGYAQKAIAVYKQIREIINKYVPQKIEQFGHIYPRLAELYANAGHPSDAIAAYEEIASRLTRAGRDADVIGIYAKIIELEPGSPTPHLRLAEAHMRQKDTDAAIASFGEAAHLLIKLGRLVDALKVVERLLQHRPDVHFARMAAEIYLDRGEANDAMAALTKLQFCFKEDPKNLETLGLLARAFDGLGQPAKALEVLKEAAKSAKESAKAEEYNAIVDALVERAPKDEAVQRLAAQKMEVPESARDSDIAIVADSEDVDDLEAITATEVGEEVVIDENGEVSVITAAPDSSSEAVAEAEPESVEEAEPQEVDVETTTDTAPMSLPVALVQHAPRPVSHTVDLSVRIKQMLAQAEAFRLRKDFDGAIGFLQSAIDALPDAKDLREKLYDVLIEAGDTPGAIEEMLLHAQYLTERGDAQGAALILDEILLLAPGQPEATEMLAKLGYAVTYSGDPQGAQYTDEYGNPYQGPIDDPMGGPDPYYGSQYGTEFDASSAAHLIPRGAPGTPEERAYAGRRYEPLTTDPPLPSFGMDEESTQFMDTPPSNRGMPIVPPMAPVPDVPSGPSYVSTRPGSATSTRRPIPPATPSQPRGPAVFSQLDEDALEEVDFFARNSMFDEARAMLDEQLRRLPNHPLLLEKKREVEVMASRSLSDRESGTRALPKNEAPRVSEAGFDISASLHALDELEIDETATAYYEPMGQTQPVDIEEMFEQFKAGVSVPAQGPAPISESDASTHYDLGVAYKEMGLYTDAIAEFELASRDPARECVCLSTIGMIYVQIGEIDAAIDAFIRGLQVRNKTKDQEYALTYEVANAYDAQGLPEQALMFFQRLAHANPTYTDPRGSVSDRMRALDPNQKPSAQAVGAERIRVADDMSSAFDDILGDRRKK